MPRYWVGRVDQLVAPTRLSKTSPAPAEAEAQAQLETGGDTGAGEGDAGRAVSRIAVAEQKVRLQWARESAVGSGQFQLVSPAVTFVEDVRVLHRLSGRLRAPIKREVGQLSNVAESRDGETDVMVKAVVRGGQLLNEGNTLVVGTTLSSRILYSTGVVPGSNI